MGLKEGHLFDPAALDAGDIAGLVETHRQNRMVADARTHKWPAPGDTGDVIPGVLAILAFKGWPAQSPFDRAAIVNARLNRAHQ